MDKAMTDFLNALVMEHAPKGAPSDKTFNLMLDKVSQYLMLRASQIEAVELHSVPNYIHAYTSAMVEAQNYISEYTAILAMKYAQLAQERPQLVIESLRAEIKEQVSAKLLEGKALPPTKKLLRKMVYAVVSSKWEFLTENYESMLLVMRDKAYLTTEEILNFDAEQFQWLVTRKMVTHLTDEITEKFAKFTMGE